MCSSLLSFGIWSLMTDPHENSTGPEDSAVHWEKRRKKVRTRGGV